MPFTPGNQEWRKRTHKPTGRLPRAKEIQLLDVLRGRMTPEEWAAIVDTAIKHAKMNDDKSREWLTDWVLGKPTQPVEVSGTIQHQTITEIVIEREKPKLDEPLPD